LGWRHTMPLRQGVADTYRWFLQHSPAVSEAA
jgi:nucleoside-diphosphate-sugar epimerase